MRSRYISLVLGAALAASLLSAVAPASAQTTEEKARAAFRLGRAHYDNGDFLKAAKEFDKAYELSQRPQLLYNVYLAYRDANMPREAANALKNYLDKTQDVPNRSQLAARLRALEKGLEKKEENPAEPPPPAVVPEEKEAASDAEQKEPAEEEPKEEAAGEEPAGEEPAEEEPAADDDEGEFPLVPVILMGTGGAMIVGSVITGVMASSAQSDLEDECPEKTNCDPDLEDTQSKGKTLAIVTDVLLFGGIATAGVGVVLLVLDMGSGGEESDDAPVSASLGCSPTTCGGSVALSF
jgi:tetratricopeptide (TPR) repeat protein